MQLSPATAPPPQQRFIAGDDASLVAALERQALHFPELALSEAHRVRRADRRDRIERLAFLSAVTLQRGTAVRYLSTVVDRPWIAEVAFPDAAQVAALASSTSPSDARLLLLAAALRNPSLAVREIGLYSKLPFAQEVFDEAALAAADETVLLASGPSLIGGALRKALAASPRPEVQLIGTIAQRDGLSAPVRSRVATLAPAIARGDLSLEQAAGLASSPARYFAALVNERVAASGAPARGLDRILENYALTLCRSFQDSPTAAAAELSRFSALDLYLLLAYGRAEQEDTFFTGIFDRILLPKLRTLPRPRPLSRLIEQTSGIRFRDFAATAAMFERWEPFLSLEGSDAERAALISRLVRGIDSSEQPLQDAVTVSEIFETTASPERLRLLGDVVAAERRRAQADPRASALFGVLAARIQQRLTGGAEVGAGTLATRLLFDESGTCRQRHYFYYDQDGVDSFQTFLMAHEDDPAWKVEMSAGVVRITGQSPGGRRILIFANEPFDLQDRVNAGREEEAARRQAEVDRLLRASGGEATVLVHRGHSYHVDKTLDHVTRSTGLVFLGSCRGLGKVTAVLEVANAAHVFATRGIGTQGVNDPLLKNLNDELLKGDPTLDWAEFWRKQEARLGRQAHFRDYLPPHRNPASILLRAYYRALEESN